MTTEADITQETEASAEEQAPAVTPGALLLAERLRQELSEKQVADKLHITMHYVRAVEADRYDKLPGAIFARGYIKSYCELLGLDAGELLGLYEQLQDKREARREEKQRIRIERRRARNLPWVYASVAGFVGAFGVLWLINHRAAEDPMPVPEQLAESTVPAPATVSAVISAPPQQSMTTSVQISQQDTGGALRQLASTDLVNETTARQEVGS